MASGALVLSVRDGGGSSAWTPLGKLDADHTQGVPAVGQDGAPLCRHLAYRHPITTCNMIIPACPVESREITAREASVESRLTTSVAASVSRARADRRSRWRTGLTNAEDLLHEIDRAAGPCLCWCHSTKSRPSMSCSTTWETSWSKHPCVKRLRNSSSMGDFPERFFSMVQTR